jgi:hypothetical protein
LEEIDHGRYAFKGLILFQDPFSLFLHGHHKVGNFAPSYLCADVLQRFDPETQSQAV